VNIDPLTTAGLVTRQVSSGVRDGAPTKIVVARRTYSTDRADLWDALTNVERLPRWFLPISGDLRVGGRYQLEGNAGGVVERCEAPELFAVTWEYGANMSWVTVKLSPTGAGTTLELSHEVPVDDHWTQFGPGAIGVGWDFGLMGLGVHVDSGVAVDREWAASFPLSAEGVVFVQRSAAGWADAAAGDGDEPGLAREAANRTVAAYTTLPEATPES
jgi:uncharacterized protein YndB with AHSA1/START domain